VVNLLSLDDWLDRTVLAGYTSVGYRLRGERWSPAAPNSLHGAHALVTGASSGLGEATCEGLAGAGATVHMLVRSRERGEQARERIATRPRSRTTGYRSGQDLHVHVCDLSDLSAVRSFAQRFAAEQPWLRVLVNNAGVLPTERERSGDGIELTFATNVIGPFLLTALLLPRLRAAAPARVITVSSGGMYTSRLRGDDPQLERRNFSGRAFYAHTKRAQVVLSELAAERCGEGVVFHTMHPGWVDTPGIRASLPRFHRLLRPVLRDPHQGADTIVWLATSVQAGRPSGRFWQDRVPRPTHRVAWTHESAADRERLWAQCQALAGLGATGRSPRPENADQRFTPAPRSGAGPAGLAPPTERPPRRTAQTARPPRHWPPPLRRQPIPGRSRRPVRR